MNNLARKRRQAHDNPVGRAVAKKQMADAMAEIHRLLTHIGIKVYLTDDGKAAPALLGELALMLGVGAEIGINRDKDASETRRMHAALRTVVAMGIDTHRWQAAQARVLHEAATLAVAAFEAHPALGVAMMPGACQLAEEVRLGTVHMDAVAGPEVYRGKATA